ncbi:iron chaperone [Propioniciclava soli]|uniref:iron chaperone n=1 Tax=Propioniciclava soli TaxID=2775081 RepID=UPI001E5E23F3
MSVIDDYVAAQETSHQPHLTQLVALVRALAPDAGAKISWGMPTWTLHGNLVHVAAGKHHVGLYPGADGVAHVADACTELGLKHSKGAIQLPLSAPIPVELVTRVVKFRLAQQRAKASG